MNSEAATSVLLEGGVETRRDHVAMRQGTTTTVKNLFFNTPARRNFLRSDVTEFNHINRVLKRFILSYPEVGFRVIHNEKTIYDYPSVTQDERITQVFGTELYEGLVFIRQDLGEIQLEGYVSRPDMARNSGENQFIFLNKRPIQNRSLSYAVMQGFGNLIDRSQYPQYVLFLKMSPQLVDINVHPTKMEVRFSNERAIYHLFLSSVRNAVQSEKIVPEFSMKNQEPDRKEINNHFRLFRSSRPFRPGSFSGQWPIENQNQLDLGLSAPTPGEQDDSETGENKAEEEQEGREQPRLWQVHKRYICSQIKSGLVIIDQHVAHERILYEKTLNYFANQKKLPSQKLLFPQTLELSLEDFLIYEDIKEWLEKLGFNITDMSARTVLIEAIPSEVKVGYEGKILLEIIDYYRENQGGEYKPHEKISAAFACKNAIKSGEKLNQLEMTSLVDQLFATREPYFCPHGRPVLVTLNLEEIDRKFKRI